MADFLPPAGPPPPKVPEGWKAQWNEQYKEWFYVNIHTKQSQWDRPTQPAYAADRDSPPAGAPPGYAGSDHFSNVSDKKTNPYDDHRGAGSATPNDVDEDARLAARLQAEEDARAHGARGNAFQDYASTPLPHQISQPELPPREGKRGLFSKLLGGKSNSHQQPQYGQPSYGHGYQQQGHPSQGGYGGYPPSGGYGGGYPPQGGYGGYPPQGGYGGYPPQGYAQQRPQKSGMGGLGMAGGAALGLGGGLVGGMLLADAIDDNDNDNGGDNGDDGGGDDGGGDF